MQFSYTVNTVEQKIPIKCLPFFISAVKFSDVVISFLSNGALDGYCFSSYVLYYTGAGSLRFLFSWVILSQIYEGAISLQDNLYCTYYYYNYCNFYCVAQVAVSLC